MPCHACIDTTIYWHGKAWLFLVNFLLLLFFYRLSFSKQASNDLLTPYAFIPFLFRLSLNDLLRRMLFLERRCKITAFITKGTEINFRFCRKSCFFQNIPYLPRGKSEGSGGIGCRIDTACRRLVADESY